MCTDTVILTFESLVCSRNSVARQLEVLEGDGVVAPVTSDCAGNDDDLPLDLVLLPQYPEVTLPSDTNTTITTELRGLII